MMMLIIGKGIALIIGSLAVATLFSWLCWSAFKLVRHPELGVPLCLTALLMAWGSIFGQSHFLRLVMIQVALGAIVLWPVGLAWRRWFLHSQGGGQP